MDKIYKSLAEIVSEDYVSNKKEELYIYSQDPGMMEPHEPDYVVMPKTTEEVQKVVKLANKEKIPSSPSRGFNELIRLSNPASWRHRAGPKKNGQSAGGKRKE